MNGRALKNAWVSTVGLLAVVVGACGDSGSPVALEPKAVWSYIESPDVTVSETGVDFGIVSLGGRETVRIEVKNEGAAAMLVPPPVGLASGFEIDIPRAGLAVGIGESKIITITFRPTEERAYAWNGTLAVSDHSSQNHSVALVGVGQASAFTCDRDRLDFGRVLRGRAETLSVNCRNNAQTGGVLIVSPISGEHANLFGHRITGNDGRLSLGPGESQEIQVSFKADVVGNAFADLVILREVSGDDDVRVASIRLAGIAVGHAIECGPSSLDFGHVAPGKERHLDITCLNQASEPFEIAGITLDPSGGPFTWKPTVAPIVIPAYADGRAGETEIAVTFGPTELDRDTRKNGTLRIATNDETASRIEVPLTGFAGGPVISCSAARIDFGPVATGLSVTRAFTCSNDGTDDPTLADDALVVTGLESTNPAEFTAVVRGGLKAGYKIGESFTVDVTYRPIDGGEDDDWIRIVSNDSVHTSGEPYSVAVFGTGRDLPPCELDVVPDPKTGLRFGMVDSGETATLEFALRNRRIDAECIIQDVRLAPTCDLAFSLPKGKVERDILPPHDPDLPGSGELRYQVQFAPAGYRSTPFTCDVLFSISNPENPDWVVPVRGASQDPCILVFPAEIDFGTVRPDCSSRNRQIELLNTCNTRLAIRDIEINPGPSDEFVVIASPQPDHELGPGESTEFTVAYRPTDEGGDLGSVSIQVKGMDEPYRASLVGRGASDANQVETFKQTDRPKADLLWVIDNSGSMCGHQDRLAANITPFIDYAEFNDIDYHIAVTTSSVRGPGHSVGPGGSEYEDTNGRFVPLDGVSRDIPRIITPQMLDARDLFASNVMVGCYGNGIEQLLEAAYLALTPPLIDSPAVDGNRGFLRPEAHLTIIVVSDEVDKSPQTPLNYLKSFQNIKGSRSTHLLHFHAIVGDKGAGCGGGLDGGGADPGDRMIFLAERTQGMVHSICEDDWSQALKDMAASAFGFKTCFRLESLPDDVDGDGTISDLDGELQVFSNGIQKWSVGSHGQEVWSYDRAQNAVCFTLQNVPKPNTEFEVSYRVACISP